MVINSKYPFVCIADIACLPEDIYSFLLLLPLIPEEILDYGLMLAEDEEYEQILTTVRKVNRYFDATKLSVANMSGDLNLVSTVKDITGKPVIADLKVADIGFWNDERLSWEGTNAKIIRKFIKAGADYVTCHVFPGTSSLQECVEVAQITGGEVLAISYMSGVGAELFFAQPIDKQYTQRILRLLDIELDLSRLATVSDLAMEVGKYYDVYGFIGPANKPSILKRYRELTIDPIYGVGIGRQAASDISPRQQLEQFYRICGAKSAAIVGSAVYNSRDPVKAAEEFRTWRDEIVRSGMS